MQHITQILRIDLVAVPDACLRPDLTLPSHMTPFIEGDLSPQPVSVQEL